MNIKEIYETYVKKYELIESEPVKFVVSTGSLLLNRSLGIGGYPSGRIIEIYGPEATGKTTFGLHAMAEAQKIGLDVALIDAERAFDLKYANNIGLKGKPNIDFLYLLPDYGEQAIDMALDLTKHGQPFLILIDSVAAMTPKAEIEGETGEAFMGLQARMMGQGMRKLTKAVYNSNSILIFINQVRSKLGVFFGSPETTTGGRALGFYASIRIETRPDDQIKKGNNILGKFTKVKINKNKLAPPFKNTKVPIVFGKGIDVGYELFDILLVEGIIVRKSSNYYYLDERIGVGKDETSKYISDNFDIFMNELNKKYGGKNESKED